MLETNHKPFGKAPIACLLAALAFSCALAAGCAAQQSPSATGTDASASSAGGSAESAAPSAGEGGAGGTRPVEALSMTDTPQAAGAGGQEQESEGPETAEEPAPAVPDIVIVEDYRASFDHGYKGAEYQKYIVLHDTEGDGDPQSVIDYWDGNGNSVAAHFIVGKDGSIYQCVALDSIAHHAGFGDAGHNDFYGVSDESRDDKLGTVPIGDWAPDYGMNSYSIGIEMVHVGGEGFYPEEQLRAVDDLIAYIDAYYGFESAIIDHKDWRSGNSDTSSEFEPYLANYKDHRSHA